MDVENITQTNRTILNFVTEKQGSFASNSLAFNCCLNQSYEHVQGNGWKSVTDFKIGFFHFLCLQPPINIHLFLNLEELTSLLCRGKFWAGLEFNSRLWENCKATSSICESSTYLNSNFYCYHYKVSTLFCPFIHYKASKLLNGLI